MNIKASKNVNADHHAFHSTKFKSVVKDAILFFEKTPFHKLPPPGQFTGPGVYALYYLGSSPFYKKTIVGKNVSTIPIYVGKAVPPGWRTARITKTESADLKHRLLEHAKSISLTKNLRLGDFRCRFIVLNGIEGDLVVPIEAALIRKYRPLWNSVIDGFGNHDPGSGRYNQAKSEWDILHPGRLWAERLKGKSPLMGRIVAKLKKSR